MDISTLQSLVRAGLTNTDFALNLTTLGSPTLTTLANNMLASGVLHLSSASLELATDGQSMTVHGTGVDLPFEDLPCSAQFSLLNASASLQMVVIGDQTWHFSSSFPSLNGSIGDAMTFAATYPPTLYFFSDTINGHQAGLTFAGSIDLNALTAGLNTLLGRQYQALSGTFLLTQQGDTLSDFTITGEVASGINLGVTQNATLNVGITGWSAVSPYDGWHYTLLSLVFSATIPFTANGINRTLPISLSLASLTGPFRFSANLSSAIDALLDEIQTLMQNTPLQQLLPTTGNFQLQKYLSLNTFFFDLDPTVALPLTLLGVDVENAQPWTIVHFPATNHAWVLEKAMLSFRVNNPGTAKAYSALFISGAFSLGAAGVLELSTSYPDWSFSLVLQDDTTLNLSEVLADVLGTSAGLPNMEIETFSMDISASQFSLELVFVDNWGLDDILWITEVSLQVEHQENTTQVAASGIFALSDVAINVSANYSGDPGTGWQFAGSAVPRQSIPIGSLIQNLVTLFGIDATLPASLAGLGITMLAIQFNTQSKNFQFSCGADFPMSDTLTTKILVNISIIKNAQGTYTKTFSGLIMIGSRQFSLTFSADPTSTTFIATYTNKNGEQLLIKDDLVAPLSPTLAQYVPDDLEIDLKEILIIFDKTTAGTTFVFGMDIAATLPSLSDLPLIGQDLPSNQTIAVNNLQILVASQSVTQAQVQTFNTLLPTGVTKLANTDLGAGLAMAAAITFGSAAPQVISVPVVASGVTPPHPPVAQPGVTPGNNIKWFNLQKTFGPVTFNKIGFQYKDAAIWFLLDATLSAFGLTVDLEGLAMGSPISNFSPSFRLDGMGINYQSSDVVSVTGAFLNAGNDEFIGEALIKTSELTLSALGSYALLNGNPSLFVYAFLDEPLGGPPFFFVTGVAAGFGYNRKLILPPIEQVGQFPLIADVLSNTKRSLEDELKALDTYIPPSMGDLFFAAGVRFTSFKMMDSFALLTVSLGQRVEIGVLGLSTLIAPTPEVGKSVPPLAEVYLELKASFAPEEGTLAVNAQLTNASYIFAKDCHLTGGFAFYSWFGKEHTGDFVITLGGYHPQFAVPAHYPQVPRLGFNWQVDSNLMAKGNLYYALTASALMAGGHLEVTWESGDFKAWFNAGADFLLGWKPYYYKASAYVNIGASYTFQLFGTHQLTVDVGAGIQMWGPDFSGIAHVDLSIVSFDITFGAATNTPPQPITWSSFSTSFLPDASTTCTIAMQEGLLNSPPSSPVQWVLNPSDFTIAVGSVIPISQATLNTQAIGNLPAPTFGIGPMAVTSDDILSTFAITLSSGKMVITESEFACTPIYKNMPVALWGQQLQPALNGPAFVPNALAGFAISPAQTPSTGATVTIQPNVLQFLPDPLGNVFAWNAPLTASNSVADDADRRTAISSTIAASNTVTQRNALLAALGMTLSANVTADVASSFLVAPQVAA